METLHLPIHDEIDNFIGGTWSTTKQEAERLAYLASSVPSGGMIVEIGSYAGRSTCYMASVLQPNVTIVCVDTWPHAGQKQNFLKNIQHFGFEKVVIPINLPSAKVAKTFTGVIDFLFIDGDHHYDGVKADFYGWNGFVKPNGIIAFHDYQGSGWVDVKKFVDEDVVPKLGLVQIYEKLWIGRKLSHG